MGFLQEYWSGLPFPSPGDLTDRGIEPGSPALQADPLPNSQRLQMQFCLCYVVENGFIQMNSSCD